MKRVVWLGALTLITGSCFAQHGMRIGPRSLRGFENRTFGPPVFSTLKLPGGLVLAPEQISINGGIPPLSAIPPLGVNRLGVDVLRLSLPGFNLGFNQLFGGGFASGGLFPYGAYPLLPVTG